MEPSREPRHFEWRRQFGILLSPIGFGYQAAGVIDEGYNITDFVNDVTNPSTGIYAQDEWNVTNNLKVTCGLRADFPYNSGITTGLSHAYPNVDAADSLPRVGVG